MSSELPQSLIDAAKKFAKELSGEDELGAAIRGHLHIENQLNRLLENSVKHPKLLPNLEYAQKVDICLALGLRTELRQPLYKVGEIRNRYAHRSDYEMPKSMMVDSLTASSEWFREMVYDIARVMLGDESKTHFNELGPRAMFQAFMTVAWTQTSMEVFVLLGEAKWKVAS